MSASIVFLKTIILCIPENTERVLRRWFSVTHKRDQPAQASWLPQLNSFLYYTYHSLIQRVFAVEYLLLDVYYTSRSATKLSLHLATKSERDREGERERGRIVELATKLWQATSNLHGLNESTITVQHWSCP